MPTLAALRLMDVIMTASREGDTATVLQRIPSEPRRERRLVGFIIRIAMQREPLAQPPFAGASQDMPPIWIEMATASRANKENEKALSYSEQIRNISLESEVLNVHSRSAYGCCACRAYWSNCHTRLVNQASSMSSKRLDSLGDYVRHGYRVRLDCSMCKRTVIQSPQSMIQVCQQRKVSYQIASVQRHLKCSQCGSRNIQVGPAFGT